MISFVEDGHRFQFRVAGACLHHSHILLQTTNSADFHILPGGRVETGEDSETALKREMREELGCETKVERLIWIVENFFTLGEEKYHEVLFIYEATPEDETILDPSWKFATTDTGIEIFFRWHPLEEIGKVNLKPKFLSEAFKKPPENTEHIVIRGKADS
ncbi:MAG: NUDIX domain-containing protein [Rubrobacter sp.]|jgi:ADP-ribose pyrophosphatase YjhB (NUDIX family)|nr:NUDIX domain-containing protein [Rubrobacter sp.]